MIIDILKWGLVTLATMMAAGCGAFLACALHLARENDQCDD